MFHQLPLHLILLFLIPLFQVPAGVLSLLLIARLATAACFFRPMLNFFFVVSCRMTRAWGDGRSSSWAAWIWAPSEVKLKTAVAFQPQAVDSNHFFVCSLCLLREASWSVDRSAQDARQSATWICTVRESFSALVWWTTHPLAAGSSLSVFLVSRPLTFVLTNIHFS